MGCGLTSPFSACRKDKITILTVDGEPLFFQHYDGPWFPTLKLLHKCA